MACFLSNLSLGNRFTANLLGNRREKEFWQSVKIWQRYHHEYGVSMEHGVLAKYIFNTLKSAASLIYIFLRYFYANMQFKLLNLNCLIFIIPSIIEERFYLSILRTRSSAIAEGPRDASCQLKSCQLPRNSAETTYTTSPDQIDGMKLEI